MNVVVASGLSKAYRTAGARVQALDDVSLEISAGEIFCLLGPNGAGKTMFIECLPGLKHPSDATIDLLGRRLAIGPEDLVPEGQDLETAFVNLIEHSGAA